MLELRVCNGEMVDACEAWSDVKRWQDSVFWLGEGLVACVAFFWSNKPQQTIALWRLRDVKPHQATNRSKQDHPGSFANPHEQNRTNINPKANLKRFELVFRSRFLKTWYITWIRLTRVSNNFCPQTGVFALSTRRNWSNLDSKDLHHWKLRLWDLWRTMEGL